MAANWQIPTVENRDEELLQSLLQNQQIPVNNNNSDLVNALQNITQPVDQFAQDYIVDPLNKLGGGTGDSLKSLVNFLPELSFGADVRDATQGSNQIIEGIKNKDISEALEGAAYMTAGIAGGIPVYGDVAKEAAQAAIPFMFGTARNLNLPKVSDELVDAVTNANDLDNLGFYSPTERLAANLQPKGTGQQYLGILAKGDGQGSRIQEEMQDMGLDTWLQSKGKVSRDEVLDYIGDNRLRYGKETLGVADEAQHRQARLDYASNNAEYPDDMNDAAYEYFNNPTPQNETAFNKAAYSAGVDLKKMEIYANEVTTTTPTKYQQYSQKGGTDYQEGLLTVPREANKDIIIKQTENNSLGEPRYRAIHRQSGLEVSNGGVVVQGGSPNEVMMRAERAIEEMGGKAGAYKSPHYSPANIGLTTRTQSMNTPQGDSVHLMDELQSDWHSDGRTKGYKTPEAQAPMLKWEARNKALHDEGKRLNNQLTNNMLRHELEADPIKAAQLKAKAKEQEAIIWQRKDAISKELEEMGKRPLGGQVPNAPSKQSWMNQGIKSELTNTINDGKDYFAWTGGDIQARRYDLSNQVDGLRIDRIGDNKYEVWGQEKGTSKYMRVDTGIKGDDLHKYVGKDLSEKALKDIKDKPSASFTAEGVDLEVGGEGMKGFYDKDVKKRTEKIIKKLDPNAKVEIIELDNGNKVWGVKITDKMRRKTKTEGMSMYSVAPVGVGVGGAAVASTLMNEKEKDYRNTPQTY